MKTLIFVSILMFVKISLAAGGGAHGDEGIPWGQLIIPQIVNITFFVGVLIYFTRGLIVDSFASRAEAFEVAKIAATKAKDDAEAKHQEIRRKISQLEETKQAEIIKAKLNAEELKKTLINSAHLQAEKIQKDAEASIQAELQKTILTLRDETIAKSVDHAEEKLQKIHFQGKSFVNQVQEKNQRARA